MTMRLYLLMIYSGLIFFKKCPLVALLTTFYEIIIIFTLFKKVILIPIFFVFKLLNKATIF